MGVWAAYDRDAAWSRFDLIAIGLVLMLVIGWAGLAGGDQSMALISQGCALFAAIVGVYFLLACDWTLRDSSKLSGLYGLGVWIQSNRPIQLPGDIHPNAAAGALAVSLPPGLAGYAWARTQRQPVVAFAVALAMLIALAALVLTASRGAWLAVIAGGLAAGYIVWRAMPSPRPWLSQGGLTRWLDDAVLAVGVLVLLGGFWFAVTKPAFESLVRAVAPGAAASALSRAELWRDVLALIRDYAFTGGGLASFEMLYSSYVLIIPNVYLSHAHNLYLETAIEQGLPGLVALLMLAGSAVRNSMRVRPGKSLDLWFRSATLASLVALLVHGVLDSQFFASPFVPIMFVPFGLALALTRKSALEAEHLKVSGAARMAPLMVLLPSTFLVLVLGVLLVPRLQAVLQANLGAVAQTRAELAAYQWPKWLNQDAIRRYPGAIDLSSAMARYQAALASDPANVTANRRLGQIELSLGEDAAARRHLEVAFEGAPHERATRQLLGESYALVGDVDRAVALWRTVDLGQGELRFRRLWWSCYAQFYREEGNMQRATAIALAVYLTERDDVPDPAYVPDTSC